jgi:hypothetical protein
MVLAAFIIVGLYLVAAAAMMFQEWREHRRLDIVGCLAWPWWFARYSTRMWRERTRQYDEKRQG